MPLLLNDTVARVISELFQAESQSQTGADAAEVTAQELAAPVRTHEDLGAVIALPEPLEPVRRRQLGRSLEEKVAGLRVHRERLEPGHQRAQVRELRWRAADLEGIVGVAVCAEEPRLVPEDRSSQRRIGLDDLEPVARPAWRIVPVPLLALEDDAGRSLQLVRAGSRHHAHDRARPRSAWPRPPRRS